MIHEIPHADGLLRTRHHLNRICCNGMETKNRFSKNCREERGDRSISRMRDGVPCQQQQRRAGPRRACSAWRGARGAALRLSSWCPWWWRSLRSAATEEERLRCVSLLVASCFDSSCGDGAEAKRQTIGKSLRRWKCWDERCVSSWKHLSLQFSLEKERNTYGSFFLFLLGHPVI
jgi:hypothetical protein